MKTPDELKKLRKEHRSKVKRTRFIWTFMSIITLVIVTYFTYSMSPFLGIGVGLLLAYLFVEAGWQKVSADPPKKGIITRYGKRMYGFTLDEGWVFLPLYGFVFKLIQVTFERTPLSFDIETRVADKSEVKIPIGIAVRVDKSNIINYLDSGRLEEVEAHLEDSIDERLREWALSKEEGPSNWEEMINVGVEGVSILVRKLVPRDKLPIIPNWAQDVPTFILLQYFRRPQPKKGKVMKYTEDWVKKDWEKVETSLKAGYKEAKNENPNELGTYEEELKNLKDKVEERRQVIKDLQRGNGSLKISSLGIIIERLNIGQVELLGDAAKMADKQAVEKIEQEAEKTEIENVKGLIKYLMEELDFSRKEAKEIVQSERGKVPVSVNEHKLSVSDDSATASLLPGLISSVLNSNKDKDEG